MVGHTALARGIGVRIPASQPLKSVPFIDCSFGGVESRFIVESVIPYWDSKWRSLGEKFLRRGKGQPATLPVKSPLAKAKRPKRNRIGG